jgi:hypothetical protein
MKIYLVWKETIADGHSVVVGFCKTEDEAYMMCDKLLQSSRKYCYWVEELEELQ